MKQLTIILLLLLPAIAFAQERIYLYESYNSDIFIVNQGTLDNPSLEVWFQLSGVKADTLFLVVPDASIEDMNLYFRALGDRYAEWRRIAKRNKVQEFKKPFDIACPNILFRWTQHVKSYSYWEWKEIKTFQSELGPYFKPVFSVINGNGGLVVGEFHYNDDPSHNEDIQFLGKGKYDEYTIEDSDLIVEAIEKGDFIPKTTPKEDSQIFYAMYILHAKDINRFISVLDKKAIYRTYGRKRSRRTQADIDMLFE